MVIYHCEMNAECYQIRNAQLIVASEFHLCKQAPTGAIQLENGGMPIKSHFLVNVLLEEL